MRVLQTIYTATGNRIAQAKNMAKLLCGAGFISIILGGSAFAQNMDVSVTWVNHTSSLFQVGVLTAANTCIRDPGQLSFQIEPNSDLQFVITKNPICPAGVVNLKWYVQEVTMRPFQANISWKNWSEGEGESEQYFSEVNRQLISKSPYDKLFSATCDAKGTNCLNHSANVPGDRFAIKILPGSAMTASEVLMNELLQPSD